MTSISTKRPWGAAPRQSRSEPAYGPKILCVNFVEQGEVLHALQITGGLYHMIQGQTSRFQHRDHILQSLNGLGSHAVCQGTVSGIKPSCRRQRSDRLFQWLGIRPIAAGALSVCRISIQYASFLWEFHHIFSDSICLQARRTRLSTVSNCSAARWMVCCGAAKFSRIWVSDFSPSGKNQCP